MFGAFAKPEIFTWRGKEIVAQRILYAGMGTGLSSNPLRSSRIRPAKTADSTYVDASTMSHVLVHFNFAIARQPLEHPSMAGFTSQLAAVNRLAEASAGFVWTPLDDEAGDAVATFGNPLVLANMSTWRSLEDLRRFVYGGQHGGALRQRREWFEVIEGPAYVLWWAEHGHRPNWIEAKHRLAHLKAHGPMPHAFTFSHAFNPSGERLVTSETM